MTYSPEFRAKAVTESLTRPMVHVAEEMHINPRSISTWARQAGIKLPLHRHTCFTDEHDDFMRKNATMCKHQIASVLGFSYSQISSRMSYLKIYGNRRFVKWGREETRTMRELVKKVGVTKAAEAMGRTYFSVYAKAREEGLLERKWLK